jgi:hypothetical protein
LRYFDQEDLFLTTYRALTTRPEDILQSIHGFLGVNKKEPPDLLNSVPKKGAYSKVRLRVIRLINRLRFEYFYEGQRLRPKNHIGLLERIALKTLNAIDRRLLRRYVDEGRPSLQPEVHWKVSSYYRDDSQRLRDAFDLEVDHWSVFANAK